MTSTNSSGSLVHIFCSSPASALMRLSIFFVAASVNVGTALDGSDGGSSMGGVAMTIDVCGCGAITLGDPAFGGNARTPQMTARTHIAQIAILQSGDMDRPL